MLKTNWNAVFWRLATAFVGVAATLFFSATRAAEPSDAAIRSALLADEFFSDFYGAQTTTVYDFGGETFQLDFATNLDKERFYVDKKIDVDCSDFDRFAVEVELENAGAVGAATFYLHSGDGWYNCTGTARRGGAKTTTFLFDAKNFTREGAPGPIANVDKFRFALWRGRAVDATVKVRSLKATSFTFAVLDVDDGGGENESIVASFGNLLNRCGLDAGRVDAASATAESLSRYPVVFLPIAGKIQDATVDALCGYVDNGGFVFAFYNAPEKLINKLGFARDKYVRLRDEGVELAAMTFDPKLVSQAKKRGFDLPREIRQASWNLLTAKPIPDWKAPRKSAIFGDAKSQILAIWSDSKGRKTDWPAILASPCGFFCSHIFLPQDVDAQKTTLKSFVLAARPDVAKRFLAADWRAIFQVGLTPDADINVRREKTLDAALSYLIKKGWSVAEIGRFLGVAGDENAETEFDAKRFARFADDVEAFAKKRVDDYCKTRRSRPFEGRLWWEHAGTGIYPGDWDKTMQTLADAGFNAVVPNMLWGGVAYYESDVLPRDPKVERYGDQIAQAVAAGKKHGVETHVWKVCFNAANAPKDFLAKLSAEGRLQKTLDGEEKPWLCPSNLENRALELASLEEVATKYDVDGIHFDYIRFPDRNCCYCDGCKERFSTFYREQTGRELADFPACVQRRGSDERRLFEDWRCDQITALVRAVRESLAEKAPDVAISAAVFSGYPSTKGSIGQDWLQWIEEGLLDFVCPMDYTSDPAAFQRYVENQLDLIDGKVPLYPGIGATATGISMRPEEVLLQAEIAKSVGAQGFTIFNLTKSTADAHLPAFKAGATSQKTPRLAKEAERD